MDDRSTPTDDESGFGGLDDIAPCLDGLAMGWGMKAGEALKSDFEMSASVLSRANATVTLRTDDRVISTGHSEEVRRRGMR